MCTKVAVKYQSSSPSFEVAKPRKITAISAIIKTSFLLDIAGGTKIYRTCSQESAVNFPC